MEATLINILQSLQTQNLTTWQHESFPARLTNTHTTRNKVEDEAKSARGMAMAMMMFPVLEDTLRWGRKSGVCEVRTATKLTTCEEKVFEGV